MKRKNELEKIKKQQIELVKNITSLYQQVSDLYQEVETKYQHAINLVDIKTLKKAGYDV